MFNVQDNVSKWPNNLLVKCIAMPSCLSAGDALRELDSLGCIRSDPFVLISGMLLLHSLTAILVLALVLALQYQ
jgi:hypothetical protein